MIKVFLSFKSIEVSSFTVDFTVDFTLDYPVDYDTIDKRFIINVASTLLPSFTEYISLIQ